MQAPQRQIFSMSDIFSSRIINDQEDFLKTLPEDVKEYTTYDLFCHCLDSSWSKDSNYENEYYIAAALEILESDFDNYELVSAGGLAGTAIELIPDENASGGYDFGGTHESTANSSVVQPDDNTVQVYTDATDGIVLLLF